MSREPLMDLFSRFSKLISVIIGDDSFDEAQSQYKPKPISASTVKASHSRSNTNGSTNSVSKSGYELPSVAASSASAIASRADAAAAAMAEAYEKKRKQQSEAQVQAQSQDTDKSAPVSTSTVSTDTSAASYDSATAAAAVTAANTASVSSHSQADVTSDVSSASQSSGDAGNTAVAALTANASVGTVTTEQSTLRDSSAESTGTVVSTSSHEATSSGEELGSAVSDAVSNALSDSGATITATTTDSVTTTESVVVSAASASDKGLEDTAASAAVAATSVTTVTGDNTVADTVSAVNVSAGNRDAIAADAAASTVGTVEAVAVTDGMNGDTAGSGDSTGDNASAGAAAVVDDDINAESVYEDTPQEITFLEEDEDILLSPVEQKILGYFYQEQAALQDLRTTLAEHLIALVGSKCVEDFLPESYSAQEHEDSAHGGNESSADSASADNADHAEHEDSAAQSAGGLGLGVAFFEHLEPRYIELIANQLSEFQQQQRNIPSSVPWDKLYITITRKSLSGLYDNDLLPDYSWLVPDEQNATYWRNNNPDGKLNLCAISSGETEDTLGNLRQRIISSDSLKLKLTTADVLPQLLQYLDYLQRSKNDVFHSPLMLEFTQLLDEPRLADLSMVLDRLRETLSLKPINLCEYLAEVIVRYSLSHELIESMGQAVSVLHYPSDSFLFVSNSKANSKKLTKKACSDALNNMLKNRPSLLESASIGVSLDNFELEQLIDNFNSLYVGASEADAERKAANAAGAAGAASTSASAAGAAGEETATDAEDVAPEPPLKTWEAALCKEYLRAVWQSSEQGNNEARDAAFKMLCSIEWNAKLERFFSKEKSKSKKPNLYVRTINMFNSNLTADEALSPEEYAVIELTKTKINALTTDERNQLNEFYNSRRSIFSRDNAIAKEWERLIYFKDVFAEPDFLYSLSSAMLNLYNADPQAHRRLAKVELCLDVTKKDLLRLNFNVMAYFSLRYGAFLSHLGEILNQRFSVCINGQMSPDEPNPVLNFPAFFAFWQEQQEDTRRKGPCFEIKDKNTTLNFKLTPYYQNSRARVKGQLSIGKPYKISWQLKNNCLSYHLYDDLKALVAANTLQQGAFEHNAFAPQGSLQALNLADLSTFIDRTGNDFKTFFVSTASASVTTTASATATATAMAMGTGRAQDIAASQKGDLSVQFTACLSQLRELYAAQDNFPESFKAQVEADLQAFATGYQRFAESYNSVLQSMWECTLSFSACHELSQRYNELQYSLEHSVLSSEPTLSRDYKQLNELVRSLLDLLLRVGMAYPTTQPSSDEYRYAIATPFHVEALRSFASKLERVRNLIFNIFTSPLVINDRDVYLSSMQQDLSYYDAPEICLYPAQGTASAMTGSNSSSMGRGLDSTVVLLANQSLGGYTLYESEQKLKQDLGFNFKITKARRGRGRTKDKAINAINGAYGGGGCNGVGGVGALSQASTMYLEGIVDQLQSYISHRPYPLSQCTLVLSHCTLPSFARELYHKLQKELCPQLPNLQLSLVLLCPDMQQAQDLYQIFEEERQQQQDTDITGFIRQLSVTILLEQDENNLSNGSLYSYFNQMSLHHSFGNDEDAAVDEQDRLSLTRFGQIGLMVHVFDAEAEFKFGNQLYAVPVVQDEASYQPTLINFSDKSSATALGRFVVCPVLPLSKIQYLHSLYYLHQRDISAFLQAQEALGLAIRAADTAQVQPITELQAQAQAERNEPLRIATPLYERVLASASNVASSELADTVKQIHQLCDVVFYLDDLLTRQALQQQNIDIIYHQKLRNQALNFMIATKSSESLASNFLNALTKSLGLSDAEQRQKCVQRLRRDAIEISGRLLMRAQLKRIYSYELMGMVLSRYLAHEMMQQLCVQYAGRTHETYETFLCLDDFKAVFLAHNSSKSQNLADLLGLQVIRYPEDGSSSATGSASASASGSGNRYLLNLMVVESKFLEQENSLVARQSLKQAASTTNLLYRVFKDSGDSYPLDRKQWLSRMADMLLENSHAIGMRSSGVNATLGCDELTSIQQQIREGQVDILIHGISLVFAREGANGGGSVLGGDLQAEIKPRFDQQEQDSNYPVLQLKLCHEAVMRVLECYNLKNSTQQVALQALQEHFPDASTLVHNYLAHDGRLLLRQRSLLSIQDQQAQHMLATLDVPLNAQAVPSAELRDENAADSSHTADEDQQNNMSLLEQYIAELSDDAAPDLTPEPEPAPAPEPQPKQSQPQQTEFDFAESAASSSAPAQATEAAPAAHTEAKPLVQPEVAPAATATAAATAATATAGAQELQVLQARLPQTFAQLEATAAAAGSDLSKRQQWLEERVEALLAFCDREFRRIPVIVQQHLTPNGAVLIIDGRTLDCNKFNKKTVFTSLRTQYAIDITAVIPRTGQIEVHLAASERSPVYYRDLMHKRSFKYDRYVVDGQEHLGFNRKFVLGMQESQDQPLYLDFSQDEPHVLIAGGTGSGKSVLTKLLITDMVLTNTPSELRLILVDPKMGNELRVFRQLPHIMGLADLQELLPRSVSRYGSFGGTYGFDFSSQESGSSVAGKIITSLPDCVSALQILDQLTTVRNKAFGTLAARMEQAGISGTVVNLDEYNRHAIELGEQRLPRLFFIMDEFADWALDDEFAAGRECLRKIAQIGRSVGLHLILITQRPDREIIKGSIHNNFGSRIALKMSSIHDSKTILENKDYDASCLQGKGHMICKLNNVGGDGYCFAQAGFISNIDELLAALTRDYSA